MRIQRPHTAFATLSDLVLSLSSIEQHPTPIVDEALRQSLAQAVADLRDASSRLDQAKIEKRRAVSERKVEGTIMIRAVRDFYHVLTRRVQRDPDAQVWLSAFGSPEHMPKDRTPTSEWFELARTIAAAGEAVSAILAKDKGAYPTPPPSNPSAEEVAATLPSAEATDKAWRDGVAHHKQCEAALIAARQRGQRLLGHLRARLLALFQGLPPEQRRVKLQTYGFRYAVNRKEQLHTNALEAASLDQELTSAAEPVQSPACPATPRRRGLTASAAGTTAPTRSSIGRRRGLGGASARARRQRRYPQAWQLDFG